MKEPSQILLKSRREHFRMKPVLLVSFFVALFFADAANSGTNRIFCEGTTPVYGVAPDGTIRPLNRDGRGFNSTMAEFTSFFIGVDSKHRFVQVYPWLGIDHKLFPDQYKDHFVIEFSSDREKSFSLKISGKRSKQSTYFSCEIR